jgi:hypothetical protein
MQHALCAAARIQNGELKYEQSPDDQELIRNIGTAPAQFIPPSWPNVCAVISWNFLSYAAQCLSSLSMPTKALQTC